jgi:predicted esterase
MSRYLIILLLAQPVLAWSQADGDATTRLASQLAPLIHGGKLTWLESEGARILGLLHEGVDENALGAVILLHDSGEHLDSPGVVSGLRQALPDFGWTTLSLYNPAVEANVLDTQNAQDALSATSAAVRAAVNFLNERKQSPIILLGYGAGAVLGCASLATQPQTSIKGFVAVSLWSGGPEDSVLNTSAQLEKLAVPVLDIYGTRDQDAVLSTAAARALAGKKRDAATRKAGGENSATYRQIELPGADHTYRAQEQLLARRIVGWLRRGSPSAAPSAAPQ